MPSNLYVSRRVEDRSSIDSAITKTSYFSMQCAMGASAAGKRKRDDSGDDDSLDKAEDEDEDDDDDDGDSDSD